MDSGEEPFDHVPSRVGRRIEQARRLADGLGRDRGRRPGVGDTGENGIRVVGLVGDHRHARLDVLKQPERLRAVGPLPRGQVKRPQAAAVVDRDMKFGCPPATATPDVLWPLVPASTRPVLVDTHDRGIDHSRPRRRFPRPPRAAAPGGRLRHPVEALP